MPILNANTKIDEHRTVGEIQQLLAKSGAQSIMIDYEDGYPSALKFQLIVNRMPVPFKLPARFDGVKKVMLQEVKGIALRRRQEDKNFDAQTRRVAWRILKVWIAAQMALIEAGQAEMSEVFMPYISMGNKTLYEKMLSEPKFLALGSGSED